MLPPQMMPRQSSPPLLPKPRNLKATPQHRRRQHPPSSHRIPHPRHQPLLKTTSSFLAPLKTVLLQPPLQRRPPPSQALLRSHLLPRGLPIQKVPLPPPRRLLQRNRPPLPCHLSHHRSHRPPILQRSLLQPSRRSKSMLPRLTTRQRNLLPKPREIRPPHPESAESLPRL